MKNYNIKEKIKEYFFINPTAKLRVRQIERELKMPLPSVIRYAKELEKEGILNKTEISGIVLYSADRTSKRFLIEKKLFNIKSIYESGLIDYLVKEYDPKNKEIDKIIKLGDIQNKDVLIIGLYGVMSISFKILKYVRSITAVYDNKEIINFCKKKNKRINFKVGNISKLNFPSKMFDTIISP